MQETGTDSEFHLTVTGIRRDGRRRYDADAKQALARACLKPGVSLAGMALRHGVNANLLRKWVDSYRRANDAAAPAMPTACATDAFVPVLFDDGATGRSRRASACRYVARFRRPRRRPTWTRDRRACERRCPMASHLISNALGAMPT
jgi:transposase-like protein